jgi:hypothetical protein
MEKAAEGRPDMKIEAFADLVDGSQMPYEGEWLLRYKTLMAAGLKGWRLIDALLGDDLRPPPVSVQILRDGKEIARIPYDRPKRGR